MEAISHLVGGFARSARDLPLATAAAAATVGVVYLAVAAASLLVLGAAAERSAAPVVDLLAVGLGGPALAIAAVMSVILAFG